MIIQHAHPTTWFMWRPVNKDMVLIVTSVAHVLPCSVTTFNIVKKCKWKILTINIDKMFNFNLKNR
jgi:hypothetical protein